MRITEYIEEALQDVIQARTYISTNSIAVTRRTDRNTTRGSVFVEIVADAEDRLSINHDLYTMEVSLQAVTKLQEDLQGINFDAIDADLKDFATQDLTISVLNAAITAINASSGITVNGIVNMQGSVETLEQYEFREQRISISFTYS